MARRCQQRGTRGPREHCCVVKPVLAMRKSPPGRHGVSRWVFKGVYRGHPLQRRLAGWVGVGSVASEVLNHSCIMLK